MSVFLVLLTVSWLVIGYNDNGRWTAIINYLRFTSYELTSFANLFWTILMHI